MKGKGGRQDNSALAEGKGRREIRSNCGYPYNYPTLQSWSKEVQRCMDERDFEEPEWESGGKHRKFGGFLSAILRHNEEVPLRPDGTILISALAESIRLPDPKFFATVVGLNPKGRYALSEQSTVIAALQGHSSSLVSAEATMTKLDRSTPPGSLPRLCLHGTTWRNFTRNNGIRTRGLIPGGYEVKRTHVHFATTLPNSQDEVISGLRNNAEVLILLDLKNWLNDGNEAFVSANHVLCIPQEIPPNYFLRTFDCRTSGQTHLAYLRDVFYSDLGPDQVHKRLTMESTTSSATPASPALSTAKKMFQLLEQSETKKVEEQKTGLQPAFRGSWTPSLPSMNVPKGTTPKASSVVLKSAPSSSSTSKSAITAGTVDSATPSALAVIPEDPDAEIKAEITDSVQDMNIDIEPIEKDSQATDNMKLNVETSEVRQEPAYTVDIDSSSGASEKDNDDLSDAESALSAFAVPANIEMPHLYPQDESVMEEKHKWHRKTGAVSISQRAHGSLPSLDAPMIAAPNDIAYATHRNPDEQEHVNDVLNIRPDAYVANMTWKMAEKRSWIEAKSKSLFGGKRHKPDDLRSSLQLGVGVFNLGDVTRKSHLPDGYKISKAESKAHLQFLLNNWCTAILMCEAAGCSEPSHAALFAEAGLITSFSNSGELMLAIRGGPSTVIEVMEQRIMDMPGQKQDSCISEWAIFRAVFGNRTSGDPVFKAGLQAITCCIYHIHCDTARAKMGAVQTFVAGMLEACARCHVDLMAGDGNAASYNFINGQKAPDPSNSMIRRMTRLFTRTYNKDRPFHKRISALVENNTPYELALTLTDIDCIDLTVFSWGKTAAAAKTRRELKADVSERSECYGPEDFRMVSSERAKRLNEKDLWFASSDLSWHRPLMITLREVGLLNKRKRSAKKEKERYERWQQKIVARNEKKNAESWTSAFAENKWKGWSSDRNSADAWSTKGRDWSQNWSWNSKSSWDSNWKQGR